MKKILLLLLLFSGFANAQIVSIPDPNFKNFLINHYYNTNPMVGGINVYLDSNHDGEIQYTEAAVYTSDIYNHAFFLQNLNITDLTGIEAFQKIEWLHVPDNPITNLDISGCLSLKRLTIYNNAFTNLNLVNPSLENLELNSCPMLASLNLNGCTALKKINISNLANLTNLVFEGCAQVEEIRINNNPILATLNVGSHYYLKLLQCYNNQVTALDFSGCASLQYLYCTGNQLTSLNLANGNPQSFIEINASGYPDLTCIKVDNVSVAEFLWSRGNYQFDDWAEFRTDCSPIGPCVVTIPDVNFKAKLIANTAINTNGNDQIECTEAEAYTGTINVNDANISDMTGIETFKNITALSCNNNNWELTSLDVHGFTSLTSLSCTGNILFVSLNASGCTALTTLNVESWTGLSLDISGCTAFTNLDLSYEHLLSLNIKNCSALTDLKCNNNALEVLNLEGCTALKTLNCSNNNLTSLSVNTSPLLTDLNCSSNDLPVLNVIENIGLKTVNCSDNRLSYLVVSNNTALTQLDCSKNNISYLDVNNNAGLTDLNCSENNLNSLNVNANSALLHLNCSNNNLSVQNVNFNTALLTFNCSDNNLSTQNINFNTALTSFYCNNNNLTTIDTSNNPALRFLSCSHNQLPSLDLSQVPALLQLDCSYNQLSGLDFSANPGLIQLTCNNNQLTGLDVSNTRSMMLDCSNNSLLTSLNVANGYNTTFFAIVANENPNLECIQVDDADFSTENWVDDNFIFDAGINFSEDCSALGTEGMSKNSPFVFYPNPTKDVVHFSKQMNIRLYSTTGQIIFNQEHINSIDLSNQATGIYFIICTDDNGQVLHRNKLVKE